MIHCLHSESFCKVVDRLIFDDNMRKELCIFCMCIVLFVEQAGTNTRLIARGGIACVSRIDHLYYFCSHCTRTYILLCCYSQVLLCYCLYALLLLEDALLCKYSYALLCCYWSATLHGRRKLRFCALTDSVALLLSCLICVGGTGQILDMLMVEGWPLMFKLSLGVLLEMRPLLEVRLHAWVVGFLRRVGFVCQHCYTHILGGNYRCTVVSN